MIWVQRETDPGQPFFGQVKGIYANRQEGYAEELLPDDHPDVIAFKERISLT